MPYLGNFVGGVGSSSESSFSLLSIDDGSESAPSIAYKDDPNLGIYSPAQDTLGFVTNGSEALRINSSSQVSIGTDLLGTQTDAILTAEGSSALTNLDQTLMVMDSDTDDAIGNGGFIGLGGYVNNIPRTLAGIRGLKSSTGSNFNGDLAFYTRQNSVADLDEKLRITSDGRVGIGTNDPTHMLEIYGSAPTIELTDSDTGVIHRINANSGAGIWYFDSDVNDIGSDGSYIFRHGGNTIIQFSPSGTLTLGANSGTIRRSGDIDTYINFTGSDEIKFVTANSEQLRINASGNVGIGETSPSYKLHISGDIKLADTGTIWFDDTTNSIQKIVGTGSTLDLYADAEVRFFESDANNEKVSIDVNNAKIFFNGDDNTYWHRPAADTHAFVNNASTSLYINSDGEVGIKTTTPLQKLNVYNSTPSNTGGILVQNVNYGNNQDKPYLTVGTAGWTGATTNWNTFGFEHRIKSNSGGTARITVDSFNGELFCIENGGSVGIGTDNPNGKLHISSGTSGDATLILEADTDNDDETDNPNIIFRQDGGLDLGAIGMNLTNSSSVGPSNQLYVATSSADCAIVFATGTTNGYTNATERLRIASGGNVGIGDTDPDNLLTINTDANGEGVTLRTTGSTFNSLKSYSNRSGSDLHILALQSYWDNTEVTRIASESGSDTTDKDDGRISFWTKTSGSALAERVRIETSGYVGIGGDFSTIPIRNKLHITGGDMNLDNNKYIGFNIYNDGSWKQVGSGNGAVVKHNSSDGLQLYTGPDSGNGAGGAASVSARLTIDNSGNVGIGTTSPGQKLNVNGGSLLVNGGTVTAGSTYAGRFDLTVDNVNADSVYCLRTVTTMNNTGTTSGDREQGAIYNVVNDNSIGAADHEHRLWTVWNDINVYGHADLTYGTYNDITGFSPSSVPAFAHLRGTYNLVQVRQNENNTSAQYNNVWGSYNIAQPTSSYNGTIGTLGGVYGRANFGANATTSVSNIYAVVAEIDNDAGSTTTVTGRSALFYGHYVRTGTTQFGYLNNPYGILIEDDVRSYHRGALGIGSGSREPAVELHVSGDAATIRLHDTDTALSDNERSSGIQFYQSDASGAGISSAIYVEGAGSTGKTSINFYTGGPGHTLSSMGSHGYSVGDTYTDDNSVDYEVITVPNSAEFIVEDGPGAPTDPNYSITTNLQRKVIVDHNGRVGIGKQEPATALDVAGTITISNSTQENAIRTNSSGQLEILRNAATNNQVAVTIDDEGGNVAIGTTTVSSKVNISGDINIDGGIITSYLTPVINDDSSDTVTLPVKGGLIAITSFTTYDTYPQPAGTGIVYFDSGTSRLCSIMSSANSTANGALEASTSTSSDIANFTDNRTTVSAVSTTGMIRIINRSGSNRQFKITLL